MSTDILLKVVAIVVGTFLVWLGGHVLDFLFSAAQAKWGRGYNVSGRWLTALIKRGATVHETAKLRQVFHRVWGTIENRSVCDSVATGDEPTQAEVRQYAIRGTLSANVLVATYELSQRGHKIDSGAFTLMLHTEGEMRGYYAWLDATTGAPETGPYVWKRALVHAS